MNLPTFPIVNGILYRDVDFRSNGFEIYGQLTRILCYNTILFDLETFTCRICPPSDKFSFLVVEATSGVKGMLVDGDLENATSATKNTHRQFMCSHMSKRTVGKVIRPNKFVSICRTRI